MVFPNNNNNNSPMEVALGVCLCIFKLSNYGDNGEIWLCLVSTCNHNFVHGHYDSIAMDTFSLYKITLMVSLISPPKRVCLDNQNLENITGQWLKESDNNFSVNYNMIRMTSYE